MSYSIASLWTRNIRKDKLLGTRSDRRCTFVLPPTTTQRQTPPSFFIPPRHRDRAHMTSSDSSHSSDEDESLKIIRRDATALAKHIEAFARLKPGDAKVLDTLEIAIAALPPSESLASALEDLRKRAAATLSAARAARAERVRSLEAEFVRGKREGGASVRESGDSSWRIDSLEIETDRGRAQARAKYNREVVVGWMAIANARDFDRLVADGQKRLVSAELPEDAVPQLFWAAYEHLRGKNQVTARVALLDLYRELRVAITRHELSTGKADRKLSRADFPKWAFLYNLDRYRRVLPSLPAETRLTLETGSQQDNKRGLTVVVNGLNAADDYRSYCYVYAAGDR